MPTDPQYWPFPVLPVAERTPAHRKEISFLEEAYAAGYRPCMYVGGDFLLQLEGFRDGWMINRGVYRNGSPTRWEIWLDDRAGRAAHYWVDDFDTASSSVLRWLRGDDAAQIVADVKPHIIRGPSVRAEPTEVAASA